VALLTTFSHYCSKEPPSNCHSSATASSLLPPHLLRYSFSLGTCSPARAIHFVPFCHWAVLLLPCNPSRLSCRGSFWPHIHRRDRLVLLAVLYPNHTLQNSNYWRIRDYVARIRSISLLCPSSEICRVGCYAVALLHFYLHPKT